MVRVIVTAMPRIFHLADPAHWAAAGQSGRYEQSTRGMTLAEQGFIHCSDELQWPRVRAAFYADHPGELVLLEIDPDLLDVPVVREVGNPHTGEVFPHLYGPLAVTAVVSAQLLQPPHARP